MNEQNVYRDAVLSRSPPFSMVDELERKRLGHWTGGHIDEWRWEAPAVSKLSLNDLKALYARLADET